MLGTSILAPLGMYLGNPLHIIGQGNRRIVSSDEEELTTHGSEAISIFSSINSEALFQCFFSLYVQAIGHTVQEILMMDSLPPLDVRIFICTTVVLF